METLESKHAKFVLKFASLSGLIKFTEEQYAKFVGLGGGIEISYTSNAKTANMMYKIICGDAMESIQSYLMELRNSSCALLGAYNTGVVSTLLTHSDRRNVLPPALAAVYKQYDEFITTENIVGRMNDIYSEVSEIVARMMASTSFKKYLKTIILSPTTPGFLEQVNKFKDSYSSINIKIEPPKKDIRDCPTCCVRMSIFPELSELRCPECALVVHLEGAVFDDAQVYTQQNSAKIKEYDPNKHCDKWIKCIQAKENRIIPSEVVDKLNAKAVAHYFRGEGRTLSMAGMSCKLVRQWLKSEISSKNKKLTNFNNNAALIRKMVTSLHGDAVVPPQLSYDEEEKLLLDFSRSMAEYDLITSDLLMMSKLGIKLRSNKPYYPYGLFKILRIRYLAALAAKDASEQTKYKRLIEGIHIQSDDTLVDNDIIWAEICRRIPDFVYEFTDRNFLIECL
jgi:hypothetical protein